MPTVAFYTLGCKVNAYETEAIWRLFEQSGYTRVDFEDESDVYVINTCTVTNTGDQKSRKIIRRAVRKNPEAVIAVTGCYAQTSPAEVLSIPGVDIVIGTNGRSRLLEYVEEVRQTRRPINAVTNIMKVREYENLSVTQFAERTRAFLKIQEGCNNFCTFCIIPWAKGLARSRRPEDVLREARTLVENGYKEIVLTGTHTGGYGEDLENHSLADLLRDLSRIDGLERIRISSIEASQITDGVLEAIGSSDKLCRHFHIPLQSGDDTILKRMRRKYTTAEYAARVERIRAIFPDAAITTDVIVGFPGETEAMFEASYRLIEDIGFSELHVFPYSKRSGTPAARMPGQVPEAEKKRRVRALLELDASLKRRYRSRFLGQVLTVIPEAHHDLPPTTLNRAHEDRDRDRPQQSISAERHTQADAGKTVPARLLIGLTDNYLRVVFPGDASLIGELVRVRLEALDGDVIRGTPVRVLSGRTAVRHA
ncbi:MAG: tRNA (N(6)-L-threonylcarbamoyladenosine(37)-C(2))-methylthiotransferase MtaB [Hydrogenibacillus sp.]|nr:tRNA (N(6)-L-threonylcarbamoyladenosine(37)-C(2))-methylthiotransferase MtaB [Hydrogenibacillus sp.]